MPDQQHADLKELREQLSANSEKLTGKIGETNERLVEVSTTLKSVADRLDRQSNYAEKFHDAFDGRMRVSESALLRAEVERQRDAETIKKIANDLGIESTARGELEKRVAVLETSARVGWWVVVKYTAIVVGVVGGLWAVAKVIVPLASRLI